MIHRPWIEHTNTLVAPRHPTYLIAAASILDAPQNDAALRGGGHHLVLVPVWAAHHLSVQCNALNCPV